MNGISFQQGANLLVTQGFGFIFLIDNALNVFFYLFRRFFIGSIRIDCGSGCQKIIQSIDTPFAVQIFSSQGSADGRRMHIKGFSQIYQSHRTFVTGAQQEEISLNICDFLYDTDNGVGTLPKFVRNPFSLLNLLLQVIVCPDI